MYSMFFDAHCDTASIICDKEESLSSNDCHIDLEKLSQYQSPIICFAAFIAPIYAKRGYERYREIVDYFKAQTEENQDKICQCFSKENIDLAIKTHKVAAVLTVEGGEALGGDIHRLNQLYEDGVRAMTLTWNHDNDLATGCATKESYGLTAKGISVVHHMNELGILIDVSHASKQTFWDIIEESSKPIIASHSDSAGVFDDPYGRNLSDEQFLAICKSGGVCGMNLYPPFLAEKEAKISDIIAHIEHYMALGGANHIGFGFDFDGIEEPPHGIKNVQDVSKIMNELARLGYQDSLLQKIYFRNFMRVFGF